jgi:PAS domain-containing protein
MSDSAAWLRIPRAVAATVSLDRAPFGVVWADGLGRLGYANDRARELLELGSGDLAGRTVFELSTAWSAAEWQGILWERALQGLAVETIWRRPDGGSHLLDTHLARMRVAGLDLVSIYLSPPADNHHESSSSCDRLPELSELIPMGVAILDDRLLVREASPALLDILGRPADAATGCTLDELLPPMSSGESRWSELAAVGLRNWSFHYVNPKGRQFDLVASGMAYPSAPEGRARYLVAIQDQTELVRLKSRLDQHEHSFEHLAANTPGMIYKFVLSADGRAAFPYASPGSREIWEIEPEAVRTDASPILNLIHPDDLGAFQESVMRSAAELSPWEFEGRIVTQSGKTKWFHAASRPELGDQGDIKNRSRRS